MIHIGPANLTLQPVGVRVVAKESLLDNHHPLELQPFGSASATFEPAMDRS